MCSSPLILVDNVDEFVGKVGDAAPALILTLLPALHGKIVGPLFETQPCAGTLVRLVLLAPEAVLPAKSDCGPLATFGSGRRSGFCPRAVFANEMLW